MLIRPWWMRLLSDDGTGGAGTPGTDSNLVDGEPPVSAGEDGGVEGAAADTGDTGSDGLNLEAEAKKVLDGDADAADGEDEDPFADVDEDGGDDDDLSDLLDGGDEPAGDGANAGETKPDAKVDSKPDSKVDDAAPNVNPFADLDHFSFVEKAPKLKAETLKDIETLLDEDIEKQTMSPERFGAWAKALTSAVRGLVTRSEMTDALLTRDVDAAKAAKQAAEKSTAETIDRTIDRVAGAIVGEKAIGKTGAISKAQEAIRSAIVIKANEIVARQKAKGVKPESLPLDRVIKAAAIDLYGNRAASSKSAATAPAKPPAKPITAKPTQTPATPTAKPPAPRPSSRPRNTGDAEDEIFGIKRR